MPVLLHRPAGTADGLDLPGFRKMLGESCFTSTSSLFFKVRLPPFPRGAQPVAPLVRTDSLYLRAVLVFAQYRAIPCPAKCPGCGTKAVALHEKMSRTNENEKSLEWVCAGYEGRSCWRQSVLTGTVLEGMWSKNVFAFLHFVVLMKADVRMKVIELELRDAYGVHKMCVYAMKDRYQDALLTYLEEVDGLQVGGVAEVVAADESTAMRDMSLSSKPRGFQVKPRHMGSNKKNPLLEEVLPGKTVWKRPAAAFKRPAAAPTSAMKKPAAATASVMKKPASSGSQAMKKVVRKPELDKRSKSRWLWTAVECGQVNGQKKSHRLGNKRVAIAFLPKKADAPEGQPRGKESLARVYDRHVAKGSQVVSDRWKSTPGAVAKAGSTMMGDVNHSKHWRNPETGVHSNDAESEWSRLKMHLRAKFGYVRSSCNRDSAKQQRTMELNIAEYLFYTNVGRDMEHIMRAFQYRSKAGRPMGL